MADKTDLQHLEKLETVLTEHLERGGVRVKVDLIDHSKIVIQLIREVGT